MVGLATSSLARDFRYEPDTGKLIRLHPRGTDKEILSVNSAGYVTLAYKGQAWLAHRIIWILVNGGIPEGMVIDHINRDRADNRLCNLRCVKPEVNSHNRSQTVGRELPTGVRVTTSGKFQPRLRVGGKLQTFGSYDTVEEAVAVYSEQKQLLSAAHAAS